jgi:hypothetical protein
MWRRGWGASILKRFVLCILRRGLGFEYVIG